MKITEISFLTLSVLFVLLKTLAATAKPGDIHLNITNNSGENLKFHISSEAKNKNIHRMGEPSLESEIVANGKSKLFKFSFEQMNNFKNTIIANKLNGSNWGEYIVYANDWATGGGFISTKYFKHGKKKQARINPPGSFS